MAFLMIKRGDAEDIGKIYPLTQAVTVIGRRTAQYCPEIELSNEAVSRRHLEILYNNQKYSLRDLNSTNGTMLDEDRILPDRLYELRHNCKIGLGVDGESARIVFIFKETDSTDLIKSKSPSVSSPAASSKQSWLRIDTGRKEVWVNEKAAKLTRKEYLLISYLHSRTGNICSRDDIIPAVWPESKDPSAISDATIDQLVHRLREKVEPDPAKPSHIISRKSFGYMLVE